MHAFASEGGGKLGLLGERAATQKWTDEEAASEQDHSDRKNDYDGRDSPAHAYHDAEDNHHDTPSGQQ